MYGPQVLLVTVLAAMTSARTITYNCSQTPQICLNACWAINCKHISKDLHGGGSANAAASKDRASLNRKNWGYNSKPCGKNWGWKSASTDMSSPEEYPYASSEEGGLSYNGKTVSLRCVPQSEQRIQSGKVSGIGTAATTDVWETVFTNTGSLPEDWCSASTTKCVNDGHQFTASAKGVFVKA